MNDCCKPTDGALQGAKPSVNEKEMVAHAKGSRKPGIEVLRREGWSTTLVALLGVGMLAVSWQRWMTPVADSGRELDLPRRLLEGELLYRDIHYLYPPLTPYLHALLYDLFGVHLAVLQGIGGVVSLLIVLLAWRMARRLMAPSEAILSAGVVLLLCVFKPTGTMISPYAYAALYGALFSLLILWLLIEVKDGRWRRLGVGLLLGVALLTKLEFAFAAGVVIAIEALLQARRQTGRDLLGWMRAVCRMLLPVGGVALGLALPVYGYFLLRVGWETLLLDCHLLYTNLPASLLLYNAQRSGFDHPWRSLLQLLGGGVVLGAVLLLISWLARTRHSWRAHGGQLAALLLLGAGAGAIYLVSGGRWDGSPLRFLPVLLLFWGRIGWRGAVRGEEQRLTLLLLAVYGIAVLARVALRVPSGGAFGGFFLPVPLVLFCYLLFVQWPSWLEARSGDPGWARRARLITTAGVSLLLVVMAVVHGIRFRQLYNFPIATSRGAFYAPGATGPALSQALAFLEQETAPGEPILVLPEGSELAFFTGRRMALRHQILIPDLMSEAEELALLRKLEQDPVRYLLLLNRPMREFGKVEFGRDFYRPFGDWIAAHYRWVASCGERPDPSARTGDPTFFIHLYRWAGESGPAVPLNDP
jgi:hypothetical protein